MEHLEMVEKLREKTGVTYDEAKEALEKCNWELLDALIELERQGKINESRTATYSTKEESGKEASVQTPAQEKATFGDLFRRFITWVGKWVHKGNQNYLKVEYKGKEMLSLSVTVLILLMLIAFWAVAIVLIIGLFCGCRYSFQGPQLGREDVNQAMERASDMAEDLKQDFQNGFSEDK